VTTRIARVSAAASVETADTPNVDWSEAWRDRITSHRAGPFTIAPPWLADSADVRTIVIDPGMAFGTGDHPTTRGVIRLMADVVRPGDAVADVGAGSAVLAIAAARLGAHRVAAIELDPDAIENAELNVARNGVADRVAVLEGDAAVLLPLVGPVRIILANIISSVITQMLPMFAANLDDDGALIFSGVLVVERAALLEVLAGAGWSVDAEDVEGEWWSGLARRG